MTVIDELIRERARAELARLRDEGTLPNRAQVIVAIAAIVRDVPEDEEL